MIIGRSDQRILIDCSVSEYASLVAAVIDLTGQTQPLHVAQPVSGLLAAHRDYADQVAASPCPRVAASDSLPLVMTGPGGSYTREYRPHRIENTAELIGAPVGSVVNELA